MEKTEDVMLVNMRKVYTKRGLRSAAKRRLHAIERNAYLPVEIFVVDVVGNAHVVAKLLARHQLLFELSSYICS